MYLIVTFAASVLAFDARVVMETLIRGHQVSMVFFSRVVSTI